MQKLVCLPKFVKYFTFHQRNVPYLLSGLLYFTYGPRPGLVAYQFSLYLIRLMKIYLVCTKISGTITSTCESELLKRATFSVTRLKICLKKSVEGSRPNQWCSYSPFHLRNALLQHAVQYFNQTLKKYKTNNTATESILIVSTCTIKLFHKQNMVFSVNIHSAPLYTYSSYVLRPSHTESSFKKILQI